MSRKNNPPTAERNEKKDYETLKSILDNATTICNEYKKRSREGKLSQEEELRWNYYHEIQHYLVNIIAGSNSRANKYKRINGLV